MVSAATVLALVACLVTPVKAQSVSAIGSLQLGHGWGLADIKDTIFGSKEEHDQQFEETIIKYVHSCSLNGQKVEQAQAETQGGMTKYDLFDQGLMRFECMCAGEAMIRQHEQSASDMMAFVKRLIGAYNSLPGVGPGESCDHFKCSKVRMKVAALNIAAKRVCPGKHFSIDDFNDLTGLMETAHASVIKKLRSKGEATSSNRAFAILASVVFAAVSLSVFKVLRTRAQARAEEVVCVAE